jgi:hypothetical protein
MGMPPLAPDKVSAQLKFQQLDGACERRLSYTAFLCGAGKIEGLGNGYEIADLLHFHHTVSTIDCDDRRKCKTVNPVEWTYIKSQQE